jgi:GTP pyrophosphokinase
MLEDELRHSGISVDDALAEEIITPVMKRHSYNSVDDLCAAIGYGGITVSRIVNRVRDELQKAASEKEKKTAYDKMSQAAERREQQAQRNAKAIHGILVEGLDNCLVKFSRCCTPVPGDDIVGFITRGQGVSIHRRDCINYQKSLDTEEQGRWIHVSWADNITDTYLTTIVIAAKDRSGLVLDIATILNSINAKVRSLTARDVGYGTALTTVTLEVRSIQDLRYIMSRLLSVPSVQSVKRNGQA